MKLKGSLEIYLDEQICISKKQIELLKAIKNTGSITEAAKSMQISYKSAWDSLNELNSKKELVITKKNSGSALSDEASKLVNKYELIEKMQNALLSKVEDININLEFIPKICFALSARNQLKAKITKIIEGALNCEIFGALSSGDELKATITLASQKRMDLKEGDDVYFIFKAPSVIVSKEQSAVSLMPNLINAKVISASLGAINSEIIAVLENNEQIVAIIPNEATMDLRLSVNDEIGVIINPNDIIIGK